ncbi:MAG TPA: hypothetical protein VFS21_15055 [Roseiflexaceae bacterium]|nr:hypothetical protein [Roseiflexaceae bacterium]
MDVNVEALIKENAALTIRTLGHCCPIDFGLNAESVAWVEGFIERQRARPDFDGPLADRLTDVLGSYLGECMIEIYGGRWELLDGRWGVRLPNGNAAFPFTKVHKQFDEGLDGGESVASFFQVFGMIARGEIR